MKLEKGFNRQIRIFRKRLFSSMMALICFCMSFLTSVHTATMVTHAAAFRGKNIWTGGPAVINGRSRNYLYRWTDGWQMTFCIMPGNHMGSTVTAGAIRTNIDDEDIPYIESREDYERLAMICSWYDANGSISADNATYAAAQTAVWSVVGDGWDSGDSLARIVDEHVKGTYSRWLTLKEYVEDTGTGDSRLPEWCSLSSVSGKPQQMTLEDGQWGVELDISANSKLALLNWVFEGDSSGWSKAVRDGKLRFSYNGTNRQEMMVSAVLPEEMKSLAKNTTSLNLYIPNGDPEKVQAMISAGPYEGKIYVKLTFSTDGSSSSSDGDGLEPEVEIYRHTEIFSAHYNLETEKYCAETGKTLKGAQFQILEAFDEKQISGNLDRACMTPVPVGWEGFKVCSEALTDENGYFEHTDKKEYEYSKTYCNGHPEPEYMDVPEPSGSLETGTDNSEEIAAVEEANERAREQWEALIQACSEETDFHSEEPGEGLELMLKDRDETYQQFINLEYDYTVKEIQARYGYIGHGFHTDDEAIPVVRMTSSEAGAKSVIIATGDADYQTEGSHIMESYGQTPAKVTNGRQLHQATPSTATPSKASPSIAERIPDKEYLYWPNHSAVSWFSDKEWESGDPGSSLPVPKEDTVEWIELAGDSTQVGYSYQIYNHRTEGEIHINKKDLELQAGETQGDATLQGAVYGLYAAEDIVHPDGKTGIVFCKDELTATAVTDESGDASFRTYTVEPKQAGEITWIGHPLILGRYYIKEIARSEGYELSVQGKNQEITNLHTTEAEIVVHGRADVVTAMTHPIDMHDGSWLEFDVIVQDVTKGIDVLVSGYPEDSSFYRSDMSEAEGAQRVVTGSKLVFTGEYEFADEGEYKLDSEGNYIPLLDSEGDIVWNTEMPVARTYYVQRRLRYYPRGAASPQVDLEKWQDTQRLDTEYIQEETNLMLEQIGYTLLDPGHGDGAPWTVILLSGSTNQELVVEILDWFSENSFWDSAAVHKVWMEDGEYKAAVFHDYTRLTAGCIYDEDGGIVYVKKFVDVEGMGTRHMYMAYPDSEVDIKGNYVTIHHVKDVSEKVGFLEDLETVLKPVYVPFYQRYEAGEYRLDGEGNRIPVYRTEFVYGEMVEKTSDYTLIPLTSDYDEESGTHKIHIDNTIDWNQITEPVTMTIRAVANGKETVDAGTEQFYSDFLTDIQGVGASAFALSEGPENSYIRLVPLTYPGQISMMQDGTGIPGQGSRNVPIILEQRIIKQKVKVMKDIQRMEAGQIEQSKMDNFRFKTYLKSNLERLYRHEDGTITWVDKYGEPLSIEQYLEETQALVPVIHTLNHQGQAGARILQTVELEADKEVGQGITEAYNYEKFFHAIRVANHDKWDDASPAYTSYRPVGNQWNRTEYTLKNKMVSDHVRQFAIDWYLDAEVERLTESIVSEETDSPMIDRQHREGHMDYGDELYDEALFHALEKAEDYLKPFFRYDLDEIYSIKWDLAEDGGNDRDKTTVSADEWAQKEYFGLSKYLPYGTYIVTEQQPQYAELKDYPNKHYRIDAPKEITVPSVYADYDAFLQSPPGLSGYYQHNTMMSQEEMEQKYLIRLNESEARDGVYDAAMVPWSMVEPRDEVADLEPLPTGESTYYGYAGVRFRNIWYQARLRIEKLDSETHENLLHDEAVFSIYKAECDTSISGDGAVKFYEQDTMISGSKEFLESVGASQISPMLRNIIQSDSKEMFSGPGSLYTGIVPAGTPVFKEADKISMMSASGTAAEEFSIFTTMRDGQMRSSDLDGEYFLGRQNVGYLETPEPLDAGVYVLVEHKAPQGYVRMKPMAIEIYSDKISYYQEGDSKERVVAAIYERRMTGKAATNKNMEDQGVIYAENVPTKVMVEKVKESSKESANTTADKTVTWKFSGRIDGTLAQIGNNSDYEYAYLKGEYQGYAWRKGTLEYLHALKAAGKQVEIAYDGSLFAGYGYVTEVLKTSDDENPYVAGAQMTLFEAEELEPSGDQDDYAYKELHIERNLNQEVIGMFLEDGRDILYYDLSDLDVFHYAWIDGQKKTYGYNRDHQKVSVQQLEQERRNYDKTDRDHSIFAFKDGLPYLELTGGDFSQLSYSSLNHCFYGDFAKLERDRDGNYDVSEGMVMYHLDRDGNRDSLVDSYTGMAYVLEEAEGTAGEKTKKVLVWPVTISRDSFGNVIARDKIMTYRIAVIGENEESMVSSEYPETGYITGTWSSESGMVSHGAKTAVRNSYEQDMNGELLQVENYGELKKHMNPVVDRHGRVIYYQQADFRYHVETPLYDRDGEFVRRKQVDLVKDYNLAGYAVYRTPIFHRQGESYIMENTWITGDTTPNDPFQVHLTEGQADLLKRVPTGTYIMEEIKAPDGYLKGFPQGLTVKECASTQNLQMVDYAVKVMINKVDGTENHTYQIRDMLSPDEEGQYPILGQITEGKGTYSYQPLSGAELTLSNQDGTWTRNWVTDTGYQYLEGVPIGTYVLEETDTPEGFVKADNVQIQVENTREVQNFMIYNDHTRIEFEKYLMDEGQRLLVNDAGFTLYRAKTDEAGEVLYENGEPQYEKEDSVASWNSSDGTEYRGFITAFEAMYQEHGILGQTVSWENGEVHNTAVQVHRECISASCEGGKETIFPTTATLVYRMEDGRMLRVVVYQQQHKPWGTDFLFEYQFDYQALPEVNPYAVSYVTADGMRRFDYLPVGEVYVLVETEVPAGFAKAEDVVVCVNNTVDVQRYSILNQESMLVISKTSEQGHGELAGAHLALFRAGEQGELVQDDAHLAAAWVSGNDGRYTEWDKINRKIPDGYQQGDLRPHTLRRLPDGVYYLVELQAPDYYTIMKPEKIIYNQENEIRLIRVSDKMAEGELVIKKTDSKKQVLSGAVFEVAAYLEEQQVSVRKYSEHGGEVVITDLPVGKVLADGSIVPYRYEIKELIPPQGYAVSRDVSVYSFMPKSYGYQEAAREEVTVVNEKTRISLRKGILEVANMEDRPSFAEGAVLAVYHVTGRDTGGQYIYDPEAPVAEWITSELEPVTELVGLIAGQTYLLIEKNVPPGLRSMCPVAFSVSGDGRSIEQVYSDISLISLQKNDEGIESVTIRGRYGVGVEMSVKNSAGDNVACWIADGNGHELRAADGVRDGEICTVIETAIYSDGSRKILGKTTQMVQFAGGAMRILDRSLDKTVLELINEQGEVVGKREWSFKQGGVNNLEWMIKNFREDGMAAHDRLFRQGGYYQLVETSIFSDGSQMVSGKVEFALNEQAEVQMLTVFDQAYQVLISKRNITGTKELPGATLQIRNGEGVVIEEWISGDEPHKIEVKLNPKETYILHEELAPKGFGYASDITFQISENGIVERVVMVDEMTRVRVRKTDITGEEEVPGATMQILDEERNLIEEWISEEEPHDIIGVLEAGKQYWLHEEHAPEGYAYAEDVSFVVSHQGQIDVVIMKDQRLPIQPDDDEPQWEQPEVPEEPQLQKEPKPQKEPEQQQGSEEPKKQQIGRIIAVYKRTLSGKGTYSFGGLSPVTLPRLGDQFMTGGLLMAIGLAVLSLVLSAALGMVRRGKRGEKNSIKRKGSIKNGIKCLLIGSLIAMATRLEVYAVEQGNQINGQESIQYGTESYDAERGWKIHKNGQGLTIVFEAFTEQCQSPVLPLAQYSYQGHEYGLKSSQLISVFTKEKEKQVEEIVEYKEVEQADELPQMINVDVTDFDTGVSVEAEIPVQETSFDNWRWIPGFEFFITVEQYDLGQFYLGDVIVTEGAGMPFAGYEEALLELIGVDPHYYLIESIEWVTDAWVGDDGLVYRQARASGQKYVADCKAVYGGSVMLPETEAMAWQGEYILEEPELGDNGQSGDLQESEAGKEGWSEFWQRYSGEMMVISVSSLFLLLIAWGISVYKSTKSVYD